MRIVIISGGDFSYSEKITADDYVICADSGYDSAKENGIHVNLLMGDMDSVKNNISTEKEAILFPERKDFTDTELALRHAIDMHPDEIVLLGCMGSRADHTIANIFLLRLLHQSNISGHIEDKNNKIYFYKDKFTLENCKGKTVSLIPLTQSIEGITTKGLDYPMNNETMYFGQSKGISNVVIDNQAQYTSQKGEGIIIITDGI